MEQRVEKIIKNGEKIIKKVNSTEP